MEAVILAGGYAKRMWPYTLDKSKVLLDMGGRPVIDHILDKILPLKPLKILVSTNRKFGADFEKWASIKGMANLEVVEEISSLEGKKLGSIGALDFIIRSRKIDDDLLVVAGDNMFDFSLGMFISAAGGRPAVGLYEIAEREKATSLGVVEIDVKGRITGFEEKPQHPKSTLIATGIYFFPKKTIRFISEYLEGGNNPDAPGHFIAWLHKKQDVFGIVMGGKWIDIGSMESYERAKREFGMRG